MAFLIVCIFSKGGDKPMNNNCSYSIYFLSGFHVPRIGCVYKKKLFWDNIAYTQVILFEHLFQIALKNNLQPLKSYRNVYYRIKKWQKKTFLQK